MSSLKGKLVGLFSGMLKHAELVLVQEVGGFRRLLLRSDVAGFSAGTKVQLLLPSADMRTYTPIPAPEGMLLLAWTRAGGPGTRWMSSARAGEELRFVGPQRSVELAAGPVVIIGDETSVAVAAAFAAERPGQAHAIIQAESASDVRAAGESVGLQQMDIVGRGDTVAIVDAVTVQLSTFPSASVALTGGSELVVSVRDALRRAGVRNVKTKAYWIPGRTGLD